VTYNILLRASAQACDVARVERFFKEMETAGIYPDLVSYNGVIGAYGKAGDYVQMEKTLFVMRMQKHIKPDNVTSNTLIESYGRGKDFAKMEQVSVLCHPRSLTFCLEILSHVCMWPRSLLAT
jgi:pentatricopeptide repeat protein